jgi:hypothetical protein
LYATGAETPSYKDSNVFDTNGLPEKNQEWALAIAEDMRKLWEGIVGSPVSLSFASTTTVTPNGGSTKIHYLRPGFDMSIPTVAQDWRAGNPPRGEGASQSPGVLACIDRNNSRQVANGQTIDPEPAPPPRPKRARAMDDAPALAQAPAAQRNSGVDQDRDAAPGIVSRFNPPIRFTSAEPHIIADEAEKAIIKAEFPVFHRGGLL